MLHAVIMAGGSGTRFWPESRDALPKQMLRLTGERTMIQATVDRLAGLIPPERTLVVTNARLSDEIARQLPELPTGAVLGEPCKRDTAPCIGLAAHVVLRSDPDATMIVMPADHVIRPIEAFQAAIAHAAKLVESKADRIVTFGIRPTYPAESFGYIERGAMLAETPLATYQVARFKEKPSADVARAYLAAGKFYWNSGIFAWKARTILNALAERQPEMHERLGRIAAAWGARNFDAVFSEEFSAIRGVSIDYAVMEHARDVAVIEAPFVWDDVGSWQALARIAGADADGNAILARHLGLNTKGSIVRGPDGHLIVTLGVTDCVVVHTPDATLVANKHEEESIRQVVARIKELGWSEFL